MGPAPITRMKSSAVGSAPLNRVGSDAERLDQRELIVAEGV